ncbi:MAG: hypothetical protein HKP17_00900 [Ignavibacteriaceae bacterium]|nr:hypothetical protein [Ignavibacteria bacterium]MBT8390633.1 hypothetical protein [Ignavibacteria bacterium]NNJ51700.1 hypothetical protein [Ignavibacteriaceae bacterium]NNL22277.1 hypothetical protein [Ignavibacteriaceae bacterium]
MNRNKIILISTISVISIIILVFFLSKNGNDTSSSNREAVDKNLLVGDWVRTDASYLIKIKSVNDEGILEAQYFNPKPINVESAGWEESYGNLKIMIVLRDVNYPGSKYTLNYLPDRDILAGDYYQAVQGLDFYIEFVRSK